MSAVAERDLQALMELTAPDIRWQSFFAAFLERGEYRGHEALPQYLGDLDDTFEFVRPKIDQELDVGDVVVIIGQIAYRGRASGVEAEDPAGWVFEFKDRKISSFRAFRDPERALAAVGLQAEREK
jgi:ketosteroid isomerase-like protein